MPPSTDPRYPRAAGLLFVALTCFYLLFTGGHIYTPDGVVMYRVTQSIVERGAADIDPLPDTDDFGGAWVADPDTGARSFYAYYGLGMSLAAAPSYLLGRALLPYTGPEEIHLLYTPATAGAVRDRISPRPAVWRDNQSYRRLWYDVRPQHFPDAWLAFAVSCTSAPIAAGFAAILLLIARELGYSLRAGLAVALAAALATPLWHYAQAFFSEPLAGLLYAGFLLAVLRARRGSAAWLALGGLMLGLVGLTKVALLVLGLPALILLLLESRGQAPWTRLGRLVLVGAGAIPPLVLMLGYNFARFGDPFTTGYGEQVSAWTTPLLDGLAGLLVSPGRGLLLYCPLAVATLLAARRFRSRAPAIHDFIWLSLATLLLLYSRWHLWEGGWCWGPRFLMPVVPLLALPLGALVDDPPSLDRQKVLKALVALSMLIAFSSQMVNFHDYHQWAKRYYYDHQQVYAEQGVDHYYELIRWDWRWSPLVRYWTFPVRETMLFPRALFYPGVARTGYLLALGGLLLSASSLSWIRRTTTPRGAPATRPPGSVPAAAPGSLPPAPAAPRAPGD